ncbi:FAD dependent oxidoreductase-domain-containing protein [Aspergillus pseudoustus]|uniref:FAD dependent oxidoreductase-domain-containing protein n=1 Tax=Aspergillus pseudoustus TaxID=1810923 RepID=A0ABR4KW17_9EURO
MANPDGFRTRVFGVDTVLPPTPTPVERERDRINAMLIEKAKRGAQLPRQPAPPLEPPPWPQNPPHALHDKRSETLPEKVDFAIISSGITGSSVARTLLTIHALSNATVAVFEARVLTSGATGRSGAQVATINHKMLEDLKKTYGKATAHEISELSIDNRDRLFNEASNDPIANRDWAASHKLCAVTTVTNYLKLSDYRAAKEASKGLNDIHLKLISREGDTGFVSRRGVVKCQELIDKHGHRFRIETYTPVTGVSYDPKQLTFPYTLATPRGPVRAEHVIHCTNGWSSYLLPTLAEKISPWRATMSYQHFEPLELDETSSNDPPSYKPPPLSWQQVSSPEHDFINNKVFMGMHYLSELKPTQHK